MQNAQLPVAVIGAGPIGLAAAAHLIARGERPLILAAGATIGHTVRQWGHVRLFSPWRYLIDPAARRLLEAADWQAPDPDALPTGDALIDAYLAPLATLPCVAPHLRLGTRVLAVGRKHMDKVKTFGRTTQPFVLRVETAAGTAHEYEARAVIDASGTWGQPNPLGAGGLPAYGEAACAQGIAYGIPDVQGRDRARYANKTVLVVGSGHSAINVLLDLLALRGVAPATRLLWAMRREQLAAVFGSGPADALPARGQLGQRAHKAVEEGWITPLTPFHICAVSSTPTGRVAVTGQLGPQEHIIEVDEIVVATGFRPDLSLLRELRLAIDPWLESVQALGPLIDPNLHSCGTVPAHGARELAHPEQDFFIVGMKSYGRAPTFLLATGYEQVRSVVAALVGDQAAAAQVALQLPHTGVCSASPVELHPSCSAVQRPTEHVGTTACGG
jgi:thioredoxin reductase